MDLRIEQRGEQAALRREENEGRKEATRLLGSQEWAFWHCQATDEDKWVPQCFQKSASSKSLSSCPLTPELTQQLTWASSLVL
jgi:hypothetical protein